MVKYYPFPAEYKERVKAFFLDTLIEKHEGGSWKSHVEYGEHYNLISLDLSHYPKGTYLLYLQDKMVHKVIVE